MFKSFFRIWLTRKTHIVMIALYIYFSACGTAIAKPGIIETLSLVPRQEISKLFGGRLKCWESGTQKMVYIFRPIHRFWIDVFKFCKESFSEFIGGRSKSNKVLNTEHNKPANKNSQNSRVSYYLDQLAPIIGVLLVFVAVGL